MAEKMLCMYCGKRRRWPEAFPSRLYAKCAKCCEAEEAARLSSRLKEGLSAARRAVQKKTKALRRLIRWGRRLS